MRGAGVDAVVDATQMPLPTASVRALCMLNVFHHIPDASAFFKEASRCLVPGGRIFLRDQHVGWLSKWILGRVHHEPFDPQAKEWKFQRPKPRAVLPGGRKKLKLSAKIIIW